jgi:hypothetical protein
MKIKSYIVSISLICFVISFSACEKIGQMDKPGKTSEEIITSSTGNRKASHKDWYFSNWGYENEKIGFFRFDKGFEERTKIFDSNVECLRIVDGQLYVAARRGDFTAYDEMERVIMNILTK